MSTMKSQRTIVNFRIFPEMIRTIATRRIDILNDQRRFV